MRTFIRTARTIAPARPLPWPLQPRVDLAPRHSAASAAADVSHDFSRLPTFCARSGAVQAKRVIHAPGDRYELEADRLAEQVMRMPEPASAVGADGALRGISQEPSRPSPPLQASTLAAVASGAVLASSPMVDEVVGNTGHPLDPGTRHFMESRFGQDFSRVQLHIGDRAAASASAIGARAYASGCHVVFGADQYKPQTWSGRQLLAHELAHVMQQTAEPGATTPVQRELVDPNRPTRPTLIRQPEGITDRIEDAYGKGTLDQKQWRVLVAAAENAFNAGNAADALQNYRALYADIARLAQTDLVVGSPDAINPVSGNKSSCHDAKPGLNFSMLDTHTWMANATTAFVDASGTFGVALGPLGQRQPEVATVLTRSVFQSEKEQSLGILRHEMIHAGDLADDAAAFARADPKALKPTRKAKAPKDPKPTTKANTELLGYVEGFMTMFPLTQPAPTGVNDPAFVELLGVLDTGSGVLPWSDADASVRAHALGRLQECYCHALDGPHRESFEGWVALKSAEVRQDQLTPWDVGAKTRLQLEPADFFHGLRGIIANGCKGLPMTKMKL